MAVKSGQPRDALVRSDGFAVFTAAEAVVKGCLESDLAVDAVFCPSEPPFDAIGRLAAADANAALLRSHETRVESPVDVARGVTLAVHEGRAGRRVVAIVPNARLHDALDALSEAGDLATGPGGGVLLLVEDDPDGAPSTSPHPLLAASGLVTFEVGSLQALRAAPETGLTLSGAVAAPVAGVVHVDVWRRVEALLCSANRQATAEDVSAMLRRRRRRRLRVKEGEGALPAARRLELNRLHNIPSPGERVETGFVLVGPAAEAMRHVLHACHLVGRVPLLELGLTHPIDEPVVARFLDRCRTVVVLESRPGVVEAGILRVAERLRREGATPASVWGGAIPPRDGAAVSLAENEALSPSILARRIIHLLHAIRPGKQVVANLLEDRGRSIVDEESLRRLLAPLDERSEIEALLSDLDAWLLSRPTIDGREVEPTSVLINGFGRPSSREIRAEVLTTRQFMDHGPELVDQIARSGRLSWILVCCGSDAEASAVERFSRACLPSDRAERLNIQTMHLRLPHRMRQQLQDACASDGASVMVIRTDRAGGDAPSENDESIHDIDRRGFRQRERLVQNADEACNINRSEGPPSTAASRLRETGGAVSYTIDHLPARLRRQVRIRLRPLLEVVEVVRSRPPLVTARGGAAGRLPPPREILHARQPVWRAHFAGTRGESPGLAVLAVCEAARQQGYAVRSRFDPTSIRGGRRAWAQVMFTHRGEDGSQTPLSAAIPYGEADLLLGVDPIEAARACADDPELQVAVSTVTHGVIDLGGAKAHDPRLGHPVTPEAEEVLRRATRDETRSFHEFAAATHAMFGSDRPTDLVLLGFAYQRGLIPLSVDSIEAGLAQLEERGYARSQDAFRFGRRLAVDPTGFSRLRRLEERDARQLIRIACLTLHLEGGAMRRLVADFRRVTEEGWSAMPGLGESEAGRAALRQYVLAMERCVRWGGVETARAYRDRIVRLYEHDRGDHGRALTRHAVLPLAEAMLIRDNAYVGTMCTSLVARRLIRQRVNVKSSRGDEVIRRFLNRFEVVVAGIRLRVDFRSSDWTATMIRTLARLQPNRWRGTRQDRRRRAYILELLDSAADGASDDYARWDQLLLRLHHLAESGQLRSLRRSALRRLIEPDQAVDSPDETHVDDEAEETGVPIAEG